MAEINTYLQRLVAAHGSDLHLCAGRPPAWRIHGQLEAIAGEPPLSSEQILELLRKVLPERNLQQLQSELDTDCAYAIEGLARFRVNGFRDTGGYGAVMRVIPETIPGFAELNLPEVMQEFCRLSKGLVIITGPTGSGKSTTLAALIDRINNSRREHIITIEDPIEFIHTPKKCLINQREVHRDTTGFARALRAALRQDPDIVLVGEMRDLETMEIAIETAETGHLVFATLHTNSAATAVERMIDKFPENRQNQIRSMLADTLQGVVSQVLCKRIDGGRIAAFEILMVNTAVAALIREAKTHMLPSVMQTGRGLGMQTFADELTRLAIKGLITPEEAYIKAMDKVEIETKFKSAGIELDFKKQEGNELREALLEKARAQLRSAEELLRLEPENEDALLAKAWLLATSPFAELRQGREAVKLAERACRQSRSKSPRALAVLGAAQAEHGSFRRAIDATAQAIELYRQAGEEQRLTGLQARLNLFRQSTPYRDE